MGRACDPAKHRKRRLFGTSVLHICVLDGGGKNPVFAVSALANLFDGFEKFVHFVAQLVQHDSLL